MYWFGEAEIFWLFLRSILHKLLSANHLKETITVFLFVFCLFLFDVFVVVFIVFHLNQSYPPEYVKAEITKNETLWSVNKTAQVLLTRFISFLSYLLNLLWLTSAVKKRTNLSTFSF